MTKKKKLKFDYKALYTSEAQVAQEIRKELYTKLGVLSWKLDLIKTLAELGVKLDLYDAKNVNHARNLFTTIGKMVNSSEPVLVPWLEEDGLAWSEDENG